MNEMLQNILILVVLIVIIAIPIMIISKRGKQKRRKDMEVKLQLMASEKQLNITKSEFLASKVIGLDGIKKSLIFFNILDQRSDLVLDLNKFKTVNVEQKMHEGSMRHVLLTFKGANGTQASIPFYDKAIDNEMLLKQTIQKADLWQAELAPMLEQ